MEQQRELGLVHPLEGGDRVGAGHAREARGAGPHAAAPRHPGSLSHVKGWCGVVECDAPNALTVFIEFMCAFLTLAVLCCDGMNRNSY